MGTCQQVRASLTGVRTRSGAAHTNRCPLVQGMLGGGGARPAQEKNERNLYFKVQLPKYSFLFRSPFLQYISTFFSFSS